MGMYGKQEVVDYHLLSVYGEKLARVRAKVKTLSQ